MIDLNIAYIDHPFGEFKPLHGFVKKSERESIKLNLCFRQGTTTIAVELCLGFHTQIFHKLRVQRRFLG